ncbi:hypothetical protein CR513_33968, partial [Mucuna pruriens]
VIKFHFNGNFLKDSNNYFVVLISKVFFPYKNDEFKPKHTIGSIRASSRWILITNKIVKNDKKKIRKLFTVTFENAYHNSN